MEKKNLRKRIIELDRLRSELRRRLCEADHEAALLRHECNHSLVFTLSESNQSNTFTISQCFCPICDRTDYIYPGHDISKTIFSKSKVIDLTNLQVASMENAKKMVSNIILANLDYYFDSYKDEEELRKNTLKAVIYQNKLKIF